MLCRKFEINYSVFKNAYKLLRDGDNFCVCFPSSDKIKLLNDLNIGGANFEIIKILKRTCSISFSGFHRIKRPHWIFLTIVAEIVTRDEFEKTLLSCNGWWQQRRHKRMADR